MPLAEAISDGMTNICRATARRSWRQSRAVARPRPDHSLPARPSLLLPSTPVSKPRLLPTSFTTVPGLASQRFQNPCDGMRNARLKRDDEFSQAMIIVSSAMVSTS